MDRFERTIDLLIKAYFKGELLHGDACACAVGNMCQGEKAWTKVVSVEYYHNLPRTLWGYQQGKASVTQTEYQLTELLQIEQAFEGRAHPGFATKASLNSQTDPEGWLGLNRVLDLLYQLDGDQLEAQQSLDIRQLLLAA